MQTNSPGNWSSIEWCIGWNLKVVFQVSNDWGIPSSAIQANADKPRFKMLMRPSVKLHNFKTLPNVFLLEINLCSKQNGRSWWNVACFFRLSPDQRVQYSTWVLDLGLLHLSDLFSNHFNFVTILKWFLFCWFRNNNKAISVINSVKQIRKDLQNPRNRK